MRIDSDLRKRARLMGAATELVTDLVHEIDRLEADLDRARIDVAQANFRAKARAWFLRSVP